MIAKKVMPIILEDSFLKYELKGEGQATSRHFKSGFWSVRSILPVWGLGAKTGRKIKIYTLEQIARLQLSEYRSRYVFHIF